MSLSHTELLPAERIALQVCLARLKRGDDLLPNTTAICVIALARLAGIPLEPVTDEERV